MDYKKIGLGLGYFSLALGTLEVAAPVQLARFLGLEESRRARGTIFAFGLRELLAGGALLTAPAASANVWNRVAGDAMDAGALGIAFGPSSRKGAVAGALGFVAAAAAIDWITARGLDRQTGKTFSRRRHSNELGSPSGAAAA